MKKKANGRSMMSLFALMKSPATLSISTERITLWPQKADSDMVMTQTIVRRIPRARKTSGNDVDDLV
jgi:hypothetical protein